MSTHQPLSMTFQGRSRDVLGKWIGHHFRAWAVPELDHLVPYQIAKEILPCVDVPTAVRFNRVVAHGDTRLIVLVYMGGSRLFDPESLKQAANVNNLLSADAGCNELCLRRGQRYTLLASCFPGYRTIVEAKNVSGDGAPSVRVRCKVTIDPTI